MVKVAYVKWNFPNISRLMLQMVLHDLCFYVEKLLNYVILKIHFLIEFVLLSLLGLFMQLELTTGLGAQSTNMVFFIGIREGRLCRCMWTLQNDNKESHVGTALFWHETFVNPLIEAFHRKSSKAGLKSCLLSNNRYSSDSNGQR